MRNLHFVLAVLMLAGAGCSNSAKSQDNIARIAAADAEMNAAKSRGHATLPEFFKHFSNPSSDETDFAVKFDLAPNGDTEFIWAGDLKVDGDKISGVLSDEPLDKSFKSGQRVNIDRKLIIDWGYFKGSVMQGNYTTKVILDGMSAQEALPYKEQLGWK